jgi:PAS domain S-box-containing protein
MQRLVEQHRASPQSRAGYEALLEALPQMVWKADAEGVVYYANRRWLDYTGLSLENSGRLGWDVVLHSEDRERTWEAWASATKSGGLFEIEHRLRRAADQSYRWHLVRAAPLKNRAGAVTHWVGTCTDIEDQKQAETTSREKERLEGLGLLAGGIAHDFNNLLTSILCSASLVMDSLPSMHPSQETLNNVIRAGERAAELTRKMLSYSGCGNFFVEVLDLNQFVRDTCHSLRTSLAGRIQLQFQNDCHLPPVETDAEELRQVIVELVRNAIEAIGDERGTIWVRSTLAEVDPDLARDENLKTGLAEGTQFVALEVEDTGCGMDDGTLTRIFDPFFSTKFAGRGLGLAAVKGFVRTNGGAIRIRSRPGKGTTFQIVLPAAVQKRSELPSGRW